MTWHHSACVSQETCGDLGPLQNPRSPKKETSFSSTGKPGGSERRVNTRSQRLKKWRCWGAPLGDGLLRVGPWVFKSVKHAVNPTEPSQDIPRYPKVTRCHQFHGTVMVGIGLRSPIRIPAGSPLSMVYVYKKCSNHIAQRWTAQMLCKSWLVGIHVVWPRQIPIGIYIWCFKSQCVLVQNHLLSCRKISISI